MKHKNKTKACGRIFVIAFVAAIGVACSAFGQDANAPAADPLAAFKTDKGLISLTKVAPEMTAVSDYKGDIWNRAALFGDPGGWRSRLYDLGVTLDAQVTQVYQGVVSGGSKNGKGHGQYNGLFEANLTLDTAKLGLWSGGLWTFTLESSWGDPLNKQPGNLSPVNATALWPVPFDNRTRLAEYYLTQAVSSNTAMLLGRLDATNFLDQSAFTGNKNSQFLNVGVNSNLLWGSFFTYSTYAVFFATKASDDLVLAYGAWTPNTQPDDYGGNWKDWGVVLNPQYKYRALNNPGMVQVMLAYTSKDGTDVGNQHLVPDAISGAKLPTKSGNWLFEISGQQYFWQPAGVSVSRAAGGRKEDFQVATKDFGKDQPGLGIFYKFSWTPEDRNAYNMYASGGVGGRGVIPGRPYDRFGVGAYWLKESNDLDKQPGNLLGNETGVEAFYNLAITPWLQLSADAQWISPGIRSSHNAVVLGTRLNIRF